MFANRQQTKSKEVIQYVDTVGKNETRIEEYIKNQLKEDESGEQMTIASIGPFTGGK